MISLKLQIWHWFGGQFIGPYDRHVLPIGDRISLADSRINLFGPNDPIPIDTPFAYRINPDPNNPRFDRVTDDPAGLEYPCFSIGWGPDWWTNPRFIDQAAYAISFDVEAGGLGVDFALWDNIARAEGRRERLKGRFVSDEGVAPVWHDFENNPYRIEPGPFSLVIGAPGPPPDTPIPPVEEPPLIEPPAEPVVTLPTLADGPTQGMDAWAAWRDGRLNGIESAARLCDRIPAPITAALIRGLK